MMDVATGFLRSVSAFGASRLAHASATTFQDAGSLLTSLASGVPSAAKPAYEKLKADIEADVALVKPIVAKIKTQLALIVRMAQESIADANAGTFTTAEAGRIATRLGAAMLAIDEAVSIIATELSRDAGGAVVPAQRDALMGIWNPWVQPFRNLDDGAGKLLDSLGQQVLGVEGTSKILGDALTYDRDNFRLAAELDSMSERNLGVLRLSDTRLEAFLGFAPQELANPSEEQKLELVARDGKWWRADGAVFGLRISTLVQPALQSDPLLKKVMAGASDPTPIKPISITVDSMNGLYLGAGAGAGSEKLVLPVQFDFPAVEVRELALGFVRNAAREVTGLELTTVIAARLGDAILLQIGGAGAAIALDGQPTPAAMFAWDVSPRWPDQIGLRVKAGPIKGGGYLERKVRTYGTGADKKDLVEFGGMIQLEILKVGVYAVGILSPDPFSLVLVMGVRFPTAIELSFGFTFNGVGGILALNRRVDGAALAKAMQTHFIDRVLFPDDPVAEAPTILDQVAQVFPPHAGGFVVGPIVELGWGSQAKIIEAKIGVILSLPDPKVVILGAVRVRAPSKLTPLTDFRCEVYAEISPDGIVLIATLRDSKIAGITVSGDLGLLIQWGGGGAFALSVGGFNPRYHDAPPLLNDLARLTMDLSPPAIVKIIIKAYFAVTAGAVMAGVRGDLNADIGVASAHAWLQLDMIFRWAPRFGFAIDIDLGIEIEVFGCSFATISFKGSLEGTTPWLIQGTATVDVWFLPTFHLNLGPYSWGDSPPPVASAESPLTIVSEALSEREAWKAIMPLDGDLLVSLGHADVDGLVAHPLAALEITQSRLPLETHIDRIGSAGVTANRVNLGLPTTSAGPVGAVSTVRAPFSPGQFLALDGEALLARSGFDDLPSGCRVGAATTPIFGPSKSGQVRWHTYFRDEHHDKTDMYFDPGMFTTMLIDQSLAGQVVAQRENPYVPRAATVNPNPAAKISVQPAGASTVHQIDDGGPVLADLGVLTASEAARIADMVNLSGEGRLAAVAVGVM